MSTQQETGQSFGANSWLVEEMYEQFVHDPSSVSDSWQEFFADYRPASNGGPSAATAGAAGGAGESLVTPGSRVAPFWAMAAGLSRWKIWLFVHLAPP